MKTSIYLTSYSVRLLAVALLMFTIQKTSARQIYIDQSATGANNGSSWVNAYNTLSIALSQANVATSSDSLFLASGTYYPTGLQSSNIQDTAFCIFRGGIKLYGGYPAGGGSRNSALNKVYLDGDIGTVGIRTDNSYHVVIIAGLATPADSVLLDGLTIRNGYAGGAATIQYPAGKPVIQRFGGGVYITKCNSAALLISNCNVIDNSSVGNTGSINPPIGGYSGSGGGLKIDSSIVEIRNCIIARNICKGGNSPAPGILSGSSFGGGLALTGCHVQFLNCLFYGNSAYRNSYRGNHNSGSGLNNDGYTYGNGGAIQNDNSVTTITNCTFTQDTAEGVFSLLGGVSNGSAIKTTGFAPTITNCIFRSNKNGWGIIPADTSSGIIGGGNVNYSLVQGGYPGTGNINGNPSFIDTITGNYQLQSSSPAINTGNTTAVPAYLTTDLAGNPRITQAAVDMGAYEAPPTGLIGAGILCSGSTTVLSGYPAGGVYTSNSPSVATINSQTGFVTGITAGTDTFTYTIGNTTSRLIMDILTSPVATPITGSSFTLCQGTTLTLSNATVGGIWSSNNPQVAVVNNNGTITPSLLVAGTTTISYAVFVTPGNGCPAVASTLVTVLPKPVISGTTTITALCTGAAIQLTGSAPNSTSSWNSSNNAIAIVSNTGLLSGITQGNTAITLTCTGVNGCSSSFVYGITVMPAPPISPITGPSSVCLGDTIALGNAIQGGVWSGNDPSIAIVIGGAVYSVSGGTIIVKYKLSNAGCSDSVMKTVTVVPVPIVAAITGPADVCVGATVTLSNATAGGSWSQTNTTKAVLSGNGIVTGLAAGNDSIIYTVGMNGCRSKAEFWLKVHELPEPAITITGGILATGSFASYSWQRNGIQVAGATGQVFAPTQSGNYTVTVKNQYGCSGISDSLQVLVVAVAQTTGNDPIHLYPNPAIDLVRIDAAEPISAILSTMDGRKVMCQDNAHELHIASLPAGAYIITVYDKKGVLLIRDKLIRLDR